jgi:hypothetical protein
VPTPLPVLTRRAMLGGALVAVAAGAAGCSLDSLDPSSQDPTYTPTSGPSTSTGAGGTNGPPTQEPGADDTALVAEVLTALALAHRSARANARLHPQVAGALRPFEALHQTHGDELGKLPRTTGPIADPRDSPAEVLVRVARGEARLQRTLVEAATSAGSGALAQSFASMAASVAQLRTTLS